jgi:hypothetical protein
MSREPSYPKDAPVGAPPATSAAAPGEPKPAPDPRRTKYLATGAAIGIGSAAIVAALLYANRSRRS